MGRRYGVPLPVLDGAACAGLDPEMFFGDGSSGKPIEAATARAVQVCVACPVQRECLAHAMQEQWLVGIWGGLTTDQRARLRKRANPVTSWLLDSRGGGASPLRKGGPDGRQDVAGGMADR